MAPVMQLPEPRLELRRAIGATGLPHWKVGMLADMSATVLSHIVSGRRAVQPDEARRLALVLSREPQELFPDVEEAP